MISLRLRVVSACAALMLMIVAAAILLRTGRPIVAVLFAPAAILFLPLFASTRPPQPEDWEILSDNVARFRMAALVCFTTAVLVHGATVTMNLDASVAALGVAWWAVGFGLIPFAVYFASRRALLEDDTFD